MFGGKWMIIDCWCTPDVWWLISNVWQQMYQSRCIKVDIVKVGGKWMRVDAVWVMYKV